MDAKYQHKFSFLYITSRLSAHPTFDFLYPFKRQEIKYTIQPKTKRPTGWCIKQSLFEIYIPQTHNKRRTSL